MLIVVGQAVKGFSHNGVELIAYMTKTRSVVKYEQTAGRGMRTNYAEGLPLNTQAQRLHAIAMSRKPDYALLDFGGVVAELGPIDNVNVPVKRGKKKPIDDVEEKPEIKPAVKFCPQCESPARTEATHCYECGHEFEKPSGLDSFADTQSPVLSSDIKAERIKVMDMTLVKHIKRVKVGEPAPIPTLKVVYHTLKGDIPQWICFEHGIGKALTNAKRWHNAHMPSMEGLYPPTIDIAIEQHEGGSTIYNMPSHITVLKDGNFWLILKYEFEEKKDEQTALQKELAELDESDLF